MQYYNVQDTENSLVHECWDLCNADNTTYPLDGDVTRRFNIALEQVVGWILESDGMWQWDDTNYTSLPIGTQTLVNSQGTYTFNDKLLEIERIEIKDKDGNWHIIDPIDQKEYSDETPLREAFETDGMPIYYDKISDDTIELFPAPDNGVNVTLASGLRVYFRRTADLFTPADTSQEPGFASPYHIILAYMAAIPYCVKNYPERVGWLEAKVGDTMPPSGMKAALMKHYGRREQDTRKVMTFKRRAFR